MPEFAAYDSRCYPTLDPRAGYRQWSAAYEDDVVDEMDLELLGRLTTVDWTAVRSAVDLGCGTGRTGAWLRAAGVAAVDGVDITPEMLERARRRGAHDRLVEADVRATGLDTGGYELAISCLVDEHLPHPGPLHAEAWRLARPGAAWALVSFHPQWMIATGMPTHFDGPGGEPVAISTHIHLVSEQIGAALRCGWRLVEMHERLIDDRWLALKPQWERYRGQPVSAAYVWRKPTDVPPAVPADWIGA